MEETLAVDATLTALARHRVLSLNPGQAVVCYDGVEGSHDVETSPPSNGKEPIAISTGDD